MAPNRVALPHGTDSSGADLTQARARARARVPAVISGGKVGAGLAAVRADVAGAWPWTATPPALAAVRATRSAVDAPGGHAGLRAAHVAWNHTVAIPVTTLAYLVAWLAQHPARALAASVIAGALALIWIS